MDSPPSVASASNGNTNLIAPSETVEETPVTGGDFSEDGKPVLEATADSSATVGPDVPSASSVAGPPIDPVDDIDEESNSDYDTDSDDISDEESFCDRYRESWGITLPKVTLSAFTETGQAESSIEVPKQRSYAGRSPVISSSLADTPCATLGIEGVLEQLNATLGTSYTLNTPSLLSLLNDFIEKNDDFGTAYGRLRPVWNTHGNSNMQHELIRREERDKDRAARRSRIIRLSVTVIRYTGRSREHQNGSSYGTVYGDSVTVSGPQIRPSNGVIRLTVTSVIMHANSQAASSVASISHFCTRF